MARAASYKDLAAWQKAMTLVEACYRLTAHFPQSERYGLTAQIRRAAVSIPSNLAEGHNRRLRKVFGSFVNVALGSQAELETQLELAVRLGLVSEDVAKNARTDAAEVGRILHGLSRSLADPRSASST